MIRQLYEYSWINYGDGYGDNNSQSSDDDYFDENFIPNIYDEDDNEDFDIGAPSTIYMINDIQINAYKNNKIKIHLSLMDNQGNKIYKLIEHDIFYDVFIEAKNINEKITPLLNNLKCFNNTPEYLDCKYTAMGYTKKPIPVWRLNLMLNKIDDIYEFCQESSRSMFLNTELNDAFMLVQKGIGIYVKLIDSSNNNKSISFNKVLKPSTDELSNIPTYACRKLSIDIEVITPDNWTLFPDASELGCEIIIIACTFQYNDDEYETVVLYTDKNQRKVHIEKDKIKRQFFMFESERDMLIYFINMVNPYNTDIITGWNVRNFDLKYIYDRCSRHYPDLLEFFNNWSLNHSSISFHNTVRKGQNVTIINCFGIIILDMYDYNKINVKAKSYKLKDIAQIYLSDDKQKLDMNYKDISRFYKHGTDEEFSRLLEYCSVDAEIVLDIMNVQKVWNNTLSMADICHVPINYVINHGVMLKNRCMISQFINANTNYLLPYKHEHPFNKYEGGYVNEPIVGFHTNPIFTLDFNSLYPTTMMAFNICTTTIVHLSQLQLPKDYDKELDTDSDGNFQPTQLSEVKCRTDDNLDISMTPYMKNVGFVSSENRKGVIPQILENLLKTRKRIQAELEETTCPQKRKQLDAKQLTYKLCANAIYGMLGCSFSPLYNPDVAASVTGFGRFLSYIKRQCILRYMEEDGITGRIIYGDTDSVMVEIQKHSIAETRDIAIRYAERVTNEINLYPIRTEYEKVFCPFLIHKKKHYIGVLYKKNCNQYDKIEYKGNEMVRSDNCSLTTVTMKEIIDILFFFGEHDDMNGKITEIGNCLKRILQPWSILYNSYRTDNYDEITSEFINDILKNAIFSKKLTKEEYNNKLPHVEVYKRMKNQKQYHVGDRITFCIANTEFTDKIKPKNIVEMAYDVDEFLNKENKLYLSIHYYLDACIRKPLFRLFETLDRKFKQELENVLIELFPPLTAAVATKERKRKNTTTTKTCKKIKN